MKIPTLMLLSATGMALTGLAVWTTVEPARAARGTTPAVSDPKIAQIVEEPREPIEPPAPTVTVDKSHFTAGKTLMVEGRLGHKVLPADTDSQTFLFVDVSADAAARARTAVPLNLAIVIDKSGSMSGKRLKNAMAAARSSIERLRDGDIVSVVTYNTEADVTVEPTIIDAVSRARVLRELDKPRAAGDTCISCGIDAGMRLLGSKPDMVSRILLLSDGAATAGVRDVPGFKRIAEDCRRMGASITTIGVDVDYDERIMAALARDSNGRHFFVENPAGLPTILDGEMAALTTTVANSAELVVDLAPGVFAEQVFDRATAARGSQIVAPLGAFTAGERKTLLVQLRVPHGTAGERPVATVRLRYEDLAEDRPGTCEGTLATTLSTDPSQLTPLDAIVSARVSSSMTAATLEQANLLFSAGQEEAARELLRNENAELQRRARDARAAVGAMAAEDPAAAIPVAASVSSAFDKQTAALSGADEGFRPAPPATATGGSAGGHTKAKAEADRAAKVQTRNNQADAFDLSN